MSDTKIFTMPDSGSGNNGILAMLPALLQRQGVDPNLVALCQGRGQNGWGGDGIFGILLLFILMGMFNGGGFGFGGGNRSWGGNGQGGVVPVLNNDANTAVIMQAVQRNGFDISTLATALNTSSDAVMAAINALGGQICNLGTQMGQNTNQIVTAVMQGNNSIISQLCSCCCDLKQLITTQGFENQLATVNQTNTLQGAINFVNSSVERGFAATNYAFADQTCQLKQAIAEQTQVINDKFCQLEMREMARENRDLRDQVQAFQLSASQQAQTTQIINQLQPVAKPAYLTCSPYQAAYPYGYPYGYNNGCCNSNPCNNGCGC